MWLRLAAVAVLIFFCGKFVFAQAPQPLTLNDAFVRVADTHPELRLFGTRRNALTAELDRATLRPPLVAGVSVENGLGTGEVRGLQSAELTLTLASVLERSGKLEVRRTLAQSRIDALAIERETRRLDLLAEVARRYLVVVAAKQHAQIAELEIAQRQHTVAGAKHRLQAGASPESVVLTAQAALARAELDKARAEQRLLAARQHLAVLWGERHPQFEIAAVDPLVLPSISEIIELTTMLEQTPELAYFASEQRIREARLQLAKSTASPDIEWQFGIRRLQPSSDTALVGSISIPLGSRSRAQPDIRAAEAELASLEIEREVKDLSLYSTLTEAHGRYRAAQLEVERLQQDVLPKLVKAETVAERAYRAGAISYLEWAHLQSEQTSVRKQQLDAALDGQHALIEIQRLTGQPFVVTSSLPLKTGDQP